jgi:superfamily II DNA or RNA helicase
MSEYELSSIKGLSGFYESPAELILSGSDQCIESAIQELTITNLSLQSELRGLKFQIPKNKAHEMAIKKRISEIEPKVTHRMFSIQSDGSLSVPPGFYGLCESIKNNQHYSPIKPMLEYEGEKWAARYYQREAVSNLMKYKRATFLGATGCGKSKVISMLVNSFVKEEARVFIITPSTYLMRQLFYSTKESLMEAFPGKKITISMNGDGEKPTPGSSVVISTIQSALSYIDSYDVVIADELHTIGAETYMEVALASINAPFWYGMTGSLKRLDGMQKTIPAWAGNISYRYLYLDGVRDGYLNPIRYMQRAISTGITPKPGSQPIIEYQRQYGSPNMVHNILSLIVKALKAGRTPMVLGRSLKTLKLLANEIGADVADADYKYPVHQYIKGETKILFATTKLVGTGVDTKACDCLFFLNNGASEIDLLQAAGRTTRILDGKKESLVVDIFPENDRGADLAERRLGIAVEQGWNM